MQSAIKFCSHMTKAITLNLLAFLMVNAEC